MFSCHTLIRAKMNTSKRKTCKIIFKTKMPFASAYELTADLKFLQIVNIASLFLYVANCKWYVVLFIVNDFEKHFVISYFDHSFCICKMIKNRKEVWTLSLPPVFFNGPVLRVRYSKTKFWLSNTCLGQLPNVNPKLQIQPWFLKFLKPSFSSHTGPQIFKPWT